MKFIIIIFSFRSCAVTNQSGLDRRWELNSGRLMTSSSTQLKRSATAVLAWSRHRRSNPAIGQRGESSRVNISWKPGTEHSYTYTVRPSVANVHTDTVRDGWSLTSPARPKTSIRMSINWRSELKIIQFGMSSSRAAQDGRHRI